MTYFSLAHSELNYSIPSDFPVECAATQSQYQEYMQLASDIESLHEQRKQKVYLDIFIQLNSLHGFSMVLMVVVEHFFSKLR